MYRGGDTMKKDIIKKILVCLVILVITMLITKIGFVVIDNYADVGTILITDDMLSISIGAIIKVVWGIIMAKLACYAADSIFDEDKDKEAV